MHQHYKKFQKKEIQKKGLSCVAFKNKNLNKNKEVSLPDFVISFLQHNEWNDLQIIDNFKYFLNHSQLSELILLPASLLIFLALPWLVPTSAPFYFLLSVPFTPLG